jgi:hypothetical protein
MHKTILSILGTALIAGATVQFAAAAERHHAKTAARVPAPASRPIPQYECRMAGQARATLLVALLRRLLGAGRSLDP